MKKNITLFITLALSTISFSANAVIIIDNSTGGLYNSGIGDLADIYGPDLFPAANSSEGDPVIPNAGEPTVFTAAFGADWLNGDYTGGSWSSVADIPNSWAVNSETAIVYDFNLGQTSDLHIDLGVDNGIFVWLDGNFLFGALAPGGSNLNEYDIDLTGLSSGSHSLQILREDHGGGTGFDILVDATQSASVPEPSSLFLIGSLLIVSFGRRLLTLK